MIRALFICMLLPAFLALQGQNQVDASGRKTGHWKELYPDGKTLYEADFVEGHPAGEMVRYYENGGVRARILFEAEGNRSHTQLYYESGKLAADGLYVNQAKDSVWTYYSDIDGSVRIREQYQEGKLEGMSRSYYPNGEVSEDVQWKQNEKDGTWKQYYENGLPRLSGHYEKGKLQGSYELYFSDGNIKIRGSYLNNRSHGTWIFYNESGEEVYELEYVNGTPADWEKYNKWIQDSLKKYEVISEPESLQ
ncbi:MAG: toxin-antitoxin system YwqK family antitoxin [Bacteroidota bacterium]|nr:toxin-antitoxin system YwqK family antitoxin [Bacteroidota bacterium]